MNRGLRSAAAEACRVIVALLVACAPVEVVWAQSIGEASRSRLGAEDLFTAYALPALKDAAPTGLGLAVAGLQSGRRARALGLDGRSALAAWTSGEARLEEVSPLISSETQSPRLTGEARVSALNALIARPEVRRLEVTAANLIVDEPLRISRTGIRVDLRSARLRVNTAIPYLVRIEGARDIVLTGGVLEGRASGVLVSGGVNVRVEGARLHDLAGAGVVITGADGAVLSGLSITGVAGAAVLIHGATRNAVIVRNDIVSNRGTSNWHAGVVISDRNADLSNDPDALLNGDHYGVHEQPIDTRIHPPRFNVLAYNRIAGNRSSGIYVDGAVQTLIAGNEVQDNAKEGICLDNGATANAVVGNNVRGNGRRWGMTDDDLRRDFVLELGRASDGSAAARTPGVSLDNALYNWVYANHVAGNFGGGIKMVRTAHFNLVGANLIERNNEGRGDRFHFFGIELGAARADVPVSDLDFTPSRGNIVFANTIRGNHYAGVFFGEGSDQNDLFDNTIFGAEPWAIESVSVQNNSSVNNLTNLPSRNLGSGLDPALPARTSARN